MDSNVPHEQQSFPVVNHDDGIYSHPNELSYGAVHIIDQALKIIEAYRELEYDKVKDLEEPPKSMKGVPDKVLLKRIKDKAGRITCATSQLFCFSTKSEHIDPQYAFDHHPEPVYPNQDSALKHHQDHCWKVALLNAYRILDLFNDEQIEFPYNWIPIRCDSKDANFPSLIGSASYLMGLHYAKAMALQRAKVAVKGEQMSNPNKGNYSELGDILYPACEILDKKLGKLPARGGSQELFDYLVSTSSAIEKNGLWIVYTDQEEQIVDSKKLGAYINRYRNRKRTK